MRRHLDNTRLLYGILVLMAFLLFSVRVVAQSRPDRQAQWTDSLARSESKELQKQFQLSAGQTEALRQAWLQGYAARKLVFARFWKTDSFPIMIARADRQKDSVYMSILGQRQFHDYKDTLYRRRERVLGKTSLSHKPAKP